MYVSSYNRKWRLARRQTVPVAKLHGVQSDWLLDQDILRGRLRRWFAAKICRDRGQATSRIGEPLLGAGTSQADNGRSLRGQHEGLEWSSDHGRRSAKRSSQVHRCVSTSTGVEQGCTKRRKHTAAQHPFHKPRAFFKGHYPRQSLLLVYRDEQILTVAAHLRIPPIGMRPFTFFYAR